MVLNIGPLLTCQKLRSMGEKGKMLVFTRRYKGVKAKVAFDSISMNLSLICIICLELFIEFVVAQFIIIVIKIHIQV